MMNLGSMDGGSWMMMAGMSLIWLLVVVGLVLGVLALVKHRRSR